MLGIPGTWYEVRRCVFDCCIGRVNIIPGSGVPCNNAVVVRPPAAAVRQPHTYTVATGAQIDASRRGKKGLKSCRDLNLGVYRSGEGGEELA